MLTETKKSFLTTGKIVKVAATGSTGREAVSELGQYSSTSPVDSNQSLPSGRQLPIHYAQPTKQESSEPPPRSFTSLELTDGRGGDRSAFISSLAIGLGHDIGNIVLPMLCYLDSLDSLELPIDAKSHVKALRESAMHLKRLSNGMNLFAHDSGDWTGPASHTSLQSWWSEVQPIVKKSLSRRIQLKTDIPADLPPVTCPAHQLTRAVLNLISNANEAIPDRGTVRIDARRGENQTIYLMVSDTGHGMTEEIRGRALDPFFTTKKRTLSTGLGLTEVNDIATAAGGSVKIESTAGQGTTVTLVLPQAPPFILQSESAGQRSAAIVMKDARIASYARTLLEGAGFDVHQRHVPGEDDSLMIVQGDEDALHRACEFVRRRPNRRAIVLAAESQPAPEPGVIVIDQSHRALQRELQHAARDLS
jgi:two-component sensor histidine kinase